MTVAGIVGHACNSSMTSDSTRSTHEPLAGRSYRGGLSLANARRTAFLEILSRRAIALIGICSDRCNRRISAQSSTLITLHRLTEGVRFHPSIRGQFSPDADSLVVAGMLAGPGQRHGHEKRSNLWSAPLQRELREGRCDGSGQVFHRSSLQVVSSTVLSRAGAALPDVLIQCDSWFHPVLERKVPA
jgi:hypothetical protein